MAVRILKSAAIRAARKKLDFKRDAELNDILDFAADSMAEAYRIGAEEAQGVICLRLAALAEREG